MMKTCKHCKGLGKIFKVVPSVNINSYGIYMSAIKVPCKKCFGKGSR